MAKVLITEQYLQDVADAIRGLNGLTTTYTPAEMAAAITAIVTGCDATAANILSGKKAMTENGAVTGTMANMATVQGELGGYSATYPTLPAHADYNGYLTSSTPTGVSNPYYFMRIPTSGYYSNNVRIGISASACGNAEKSHVLSGKTFVSGNTSTSSGGAVASGTMTNRGAWASTVSFGSGTSKSVTVPSGYHNGSGSVKVNIGSQRYVDWTSDALAIRSASDPNKRIGQLIIGANGSYTYYGDRYPAYYVAASGVSGYSLCWMLVALPDSYLASS